MARKITEQAVQAFYKGVPFKGNNTTVEIQNTANKLTVMKLFGNEIAYIVHKTGALVITNAGYKTDTTKERLNGLDGVSIHQSKGVWYLNGKEWDGNSTTI